MENIIVTMKDALNNNETVTRTIDISNIMIPEYDKGLKLASVAKQKSMIESWIHERANEQHNTILELVEWEVI